jgi:hypothetical protein
MPTCDQHYSGGPVFLLTEVPELFLPKKETGSKG